MYDRSQSKKKKKARFRILQISTMLLLAVLCMIPILPSVSGDYVTGKQTPPKSSSLSCKFVCICVHTHMCMCVCSHVTYWCHQYMTSIHMPQSSIGLLKELQIQLSLAYYDINSQSPKFNQCSFQELKNTQLSLG